MKKISDWFAGAKAGVCRNVGTKIVAMVAAVAMLGGVAGVSMTAMAEEGQTPDVQTTQQATPTTDTATTNDDASADGAATGNAADPAQSGDDTAATDGAADNAATDGKTAETDPAQSGNAGDAAQQDAAAADDAPAATDIAKQAAPAPADAQAVDAALGSLLVDETFKNSTFSDPSKWSTKDGACLTASGCSSTWDTYDIQQKGNGTGYLQLTDGYTNRKGSVLYNQAIPSGNGLDITFDYYMYGGDEFDGNYGDGISFFLTDGAATLSQTGAGGAGMGYASVDEDGAGSGARVEGIAQGVLGIGLDEFGNFSKQSIYSPNSTERVTGGNDCTVPYDGGPHTVTLRGEGAQDGNGKWNNGYCVVAGVQQDSSFQTGTATASENDSNGKTVRVLISEPNAAGYQTVTVYIGGVQVVSHTLDYKLPTTIKFGFSAGTGAASQAQLIRGLSAHSVKSLTAIDLVKAVNKDTYPDADTHVFKSGDTVPYVFTVTNGGTTTLSNVTVTDPNISNISCPNTTLAPGSPMTCTGELTLTDDMVKDGKFTNTATATGTDGDKTVSDTDSVTINTVRSLGDPSRRKYITKGDGDEYTLHLNVTGDDTSATTEGTKANVVVVLDKSGSMDESMSNNSQTTRMKAAKDAINQLSDSLLAEGSDVRLSLVSFSGSRDDGNWNDATVNQQWTTNKDTFTSAVTKVQSGGGTNWEAGFRNAATLLSSVREGAQKYVVFLSDGQPGYYYNDNGATTGTGNGYNATAYDRAVTQAKQLGLPKDHIWSVSVSKDNTLSTRMQNFANDVNGKFLAGDDEAALNEALDAFAKSVTSKTQYKIAQISDTLSQYADPVWGDSFNQSYVTVFDTDGNKVTSGWSATYDSQTRTVTVTFDNLLASKGQTYTVEFNVKPSQAAYDEYVSKGYTDKGQADTDAPNVAENDYISTGKDGFFSNDKATLTYCVVDNSSTSGACDKTVDYNKPVLQVKTGSIKVTKVWDPETPGAESVTATVYKQADGSSEKTEVGDVTLSSSNEWSATLDNLAPGYTYSVEEDDSLSGTYDSTVVYTNNDQQLTAADVWNSDTTKAQIQATITNTQETVTLDGSAFVNVKKIVKGKDWPTDTAFSFTLTGEDKAPMPQAEGKDQSTLTLSKDGDENERTGSFNSIAFPYPGKGKTETYTYTVVENGANGTAQAGGVKGGFNYSKAKYQVTVTVSEQNGKAQAVVSKIEQIVDDNGKELKPPADVTESKIASFTNMYVSVSSLPLTGGTTARDWLVYGGGMGLAVLLAGAGFTVWRKRQLV